MELIFWWMPLIWVVLAAAAILITWRLLRRRAAARADGRAIANVDRLTALPAYRSAVARYRIGLVAILAAAAVLLTSAVILASRPAGATLVYPELNNRDIVLCLDVSGSMIDYDAELVEAFGELVEEFDGERVGMVVFNASAVTYFPLTSDYSYVDEQFETILGQFRGESLEYFDGTLFGDGSSLVGDGLAACSLRFDTPSADGPERSRSIILATDNLVVGSSIFSLPEAGELAAGDGIRVYGINPGASARDYLQAAADEFEQVTADTGGGYYELGDPEAVPAIVDGIDSEQVVVSRGAPQRVVADVPAGPVLLAFLGLASLMALAWRFQR